jgi:hypothetical protein
VFSSFKNYYEQGGFTWRDENGVEVLLKPYVHMFVGDIAGVNEMIGHYTTQARPGVSSRTASVTKTM